MIKIPCVLILGQLFFCWTELESRVLPFWSFTNDFDFIQLDDQSSTAVSAAVEMIKEPC